MATLVATFLLTLAGSGVAQEAARFKEVATVMQLMEAIIIPASDVLFDVSVEAPKNDREWKKTENNAPLLAESGNLLMIGKRPADQKLWIQYSQAMVSASAFQAAQVKDAESLAKAGDQILAARAGCHDRFLKKAAGRGASRGN